MSPVTLAGFALSVLFLISHSANASSVALSPDSQDLSRLSLRGAVSTKTGAAQTLPDNTSAGDVSSLQFGSSIVEKGAGSPKPAAISTAGRSLGVALGSFGGSIAVSPRCIVDTPDPAPSVAPESSSALLFGLGLAVLACVGRLRGWTSSHRG